MESEPEPERRQDLPEHAIDRRRFELLGLALFLFVCMSIAVAVLSFPREALGWFKEYPSTLVAVRVALGILPLAFGAYLFEKERELRRLARAAHARERQAAEHMQRLNETKDVLLTAVSHELRTPLTSVVGYARALQLREASLSAEKRREFLVKIADNALRLNKLLTDLLDVDRLSRGIIEPVRRPTNIGELVARVVRESDVGGDSVRVDVEPVVVDADAAQVERILENLLSNTAQHTPPGTPVWVHVGQSDGGCLLSVDDAGPGVPGRLREALFRPFTKGERVREHAPGLGIGLTLVTRFAQAHGGRAWVEDREGGGASFRVFLPGNKE